MVMNMNDKKQNGLSSSEVASRVQKGQVNISQESITKTEKEIVLSHVVTYFNFLNLFLAILILLTGKWTNLAFMGVVITNTIIGIYQELKAKKIVDKLTLMTMSTVKAYRDGQEKVIPIDEVVLDDVMLIENGQQICADSVVLESNGLEVNESLLTGESNPIVKKNNDQVMSGSFVVAGEAIVKVMHVGNDNYSTQLIHKAKHRHSATSEMKDSIEKIIKVVGVMIIPVGIILFRSQYAIYSNDWSMAVVKTVGGVIGMIPEGLVLLTSVSFIVGVERLARKKALIQEMEAIEALARLDVICLDKTGTITSGELEVSEVVSLSQEYDIEGLVGSMVHCLSSGNVTQTAMKNYFIQQPYEVEKFLPFSTYRKMSAVRFKDKGCFLLGAPELFVRDRQDIMTQVEEYAKTGQRVLLFGETDIFDEDTSNIKEVKPVALIILQDCLRDDTRETLNYLYGLNMDVRIISGDNPTTVSYLAHEVGVKSSEQFIDATLLPKSEEEFKKEAKKYYVFGRTTPEQKQWIIQSIQEEGKHVGMIGDGVNDILALKVADCSIAMASGSEAAKQASHVVLLESTFSSLKDIIEEGQTIIGDIEKVSSLYLTKTIYSTVLAILFVILGISYPFIPIQLSLIGALAIGIPSFILTLERGTKPTKQGFFRHVMTTAVPSALTMILYMLSMSVIAKWVDMPSDIYSTYTVCIAGFISFLVVWQVCQPFNKLRIALLSTIMIAFVSVLIVVPEFFGIAKLFQWKMIFIIPLIISSFYVCMFFKKIIEKIYGKFNTGV